MVMTCVYIKILHVAITQIRKIKHQGGVQGNVKPSAKVRLFNANSSKNVVPKKSHKWNLHKELQATKSVAIVYLAFCVCWLPSCVITTIVHADQSYFPRLRQENMTLFLMVYYAFVEVLPLVSTMVNPIIYSFSNKQFRKGVSSVKRKLFNETSGRGSLFDLSAGEDTLNTTTAQPITSLSKML